MKGIETFKQRCVEKGVYHRAIFSNDWVACNIGYWILTIPYGQPNGGKRKIFKRFSESDVNRAVAYWFNNVEKDAVLTY